MTDKKAAFIDSHVQGIDGVLDRGVRALRYWQKNAEADALASALTDAKSGLVAGPTSSAHARELVEAIGDWSSYAAWVWCRAMIACGPVDAEYADEIDAKDTEYRNKLQRALQAKQCRAPGFDGQGGGRARGQ